MAGNVKEWIWNEAGPGKGEAAPKTAVDLAANSIEHLAEQLGA